MGSIKLHSNSLPSPDLTDLLTAIDNLPTYIGAPAFGEDEAQVIHLANFILKRFPNIRASQLIEAFEMAAAGELWDGGKRITAASYGRIISIDLLGTILRAYREYKRMERARPQPTLPTSRQLSQGDERPSPEWHFDRMMLEIKINGSPSEFHPWRLIHKHLADLGEVPEIEEGVSYYQNYHVQKIRTLGDSLKGSQYKQHIIAWLQLNNHLTK